MKCKKIIAISIMVVLMTVLTACKKLPLESSQPADNTESNVQTDNASDNQQNTQNVGDNTKSDIFTEAYEYTLAAGEELLSINSTPVAITVDEMLENADIIVVGEYNGNAYWVTPEKSSSIPVYTDQMVTVQKVLKGDITGDIRVRRVGGKSADGMFVSSSDPELTKDKKYLLFLEKNEFVANGDVTSYSVITGNHGSIFVDDSGELDLSVFSDEDAQKILQIYSK